MANLTKAHRQLFERPDDERFATLADLGTYCRNQRDASRDRWLQPEALKPDAAEFHLKLTLNGDGAFAMNHWSFS